MFDDFEDFGGYEPFEDDLQELSDNDAWRDSQADLHDLAGHDELRTEIAISPAALAEVNALLSCGGQIEESKREAVLRSWTATFQDGCQVDLKICNGDRGPWIDCVLFDSDGTEIQVLEPTDGPLEGDYCFSGYTLIVQAA